MFLADKSIGWVKYFQEWKGRETYLEGLRRTEERARRAKRSSQVGETIFIFF